MRGKKENLIEIARENPDKEIFYDESRFGLISNVGRKYTMERDKTDNSKYNDNLIIYTYVYLL